MESFVAIHWHHRTLRVAAAQPTEGGLRVHHLFARELPDSEDLAAVREALTGLVAANNLRGHEAVVVVDREQFEMRQLAVPQAPDDELPDMVRFQAKSNFTAFGENDVVDFIRLGGAQSGAQAQLLAATLSATELKRIRNLIEPTRLKLKHIVPRPFATVNLIQSELERGGYQLVVNEFGDEADVSVVYGNLITLTRSIRLPHEPAEKNAALIREIRRTIAASRNQPHVGTIDRIVILGGDQTHAQLGGEIERDLKLTVRVIGTSSFVALDPGLASSLGDDDGAVAPLLGSLGLPAEPAPHLIDFANPRRRPEPKRDLRRWYIVGGAAAALAFLALLTAVVLIFNRRAEVADLRAQLEQLHAATKGADQFISDVDQIDHWKRGDVNWLDELSEISTRLPMPDDVIVKSFSGSVLSQPFQGRISLSGLVSGAEIEDEIVRAFQERPYNVAPGQSTPSGGPLTYNRTFSHSLELPLAERKIDALLPVVQSVEPAENPEQLTQASSNADEKSNIP
jgi:hypothetical protein